MRKINWKLRLQNKTTLSTLIITLVALIYQVCAALGFTPEITQDTITQIISMIINVLAMLGIVVDPTTPGVGDADIVLKQ